MKFTATEKPWRLSYVRSARENGGKFRMLFEEEVAELLPKNIAKTPKISVDQTWNIVGMTYTYHRDGLCKKKEKKRKPDWTRCVTSIRTYSFASGAIRPIDE